MNMSEFEEDPSSESGLDADDPSAQQKRFPDDFSAEDAAFAEELESLFPLDQEEPPPLFVQTLLASDNPRFQAVEEAFEKKTSARVFRRLHLKRRLFQRSRFSMLSLSTMKSVVNGRTVPRSLITITAACMLFMLITVMLTGQAFASGWTYLWSGAHSGVMQVNNYPSVTATGPAPAKRAAGDEQINMSQAQALLRFPLYWPGEKSIPARYAQHEMYLYPGDPGWADGPIVALTFTYSSPGLTPRQITICEFKPLGKVLQVTQNGAAQRIEIGSDGTSGIYVEGQWNASGASSSQSPSWDYSQRSELIYENAATGVVFWIVGDQRDGIDSAALGTIAQSLDLYKVPTDDTHMGSRIERVIEAASGLPWPFTTDVIYLDNPDNPDGPAFKLVPVFPHHNSFPRMLN